MNSIKTPQESVEAFLHNDFNISIYNDLADGFVYQGLFEPLEFFNHLYSEFDFFQTNALNYLTIKNHFKPYSHIHFIKMSNEPRFITVITNNDQRTYFIETFVELIKTFYEIEDEILQSSCQYIYQLYEMVVDENRIKTNEPYKYDFTKLKKNLNTIISTTDKIKYIIEIKTEFQQEIGLLDLGNDDFLKKCNLEIDKLNEFLKIETITTAEKNQTIEPQLNNLNWQGTTLEFSEFSKALIESGLIGKVKNEKEVFDNMKQFFNVDDFDKSDKLKQVRQRTKDLTPVINVLEVALTNWIKRKD